MLPWVDRRREPRGCRGDRGRALVWRCDRPQPPRQRLLLEIGPPGGEEFVVGSNAGAAVISPDGSMVAFLAQATAARQLYVRSLTTGEARAISGTRRSELSVLVARQPLAGILR